MPADVAVVVPVYRAEKYLRQCVESVLAQTFASWQLILVDDGSDDSSPALCDSLALSDPRIRAVHQPNAGVSAARNRGVAEASSPFVTFLDADDILHPRFLEILLSPLLRGDADISISRVLDFSGAEPDFPDIPHIPAPALMNAGEVVETVLYQTRSFDNGIGGKIYSRPLLLDVPYRKNTRYEDLDHFYRCWLLASRIALFSIPLYGYRQHPDSYMHRFSEARADVLDVTDAILEYMRLHHPSLIPAAADRRMSAHFNILLLLYRNRLQAPEIEARCWRVIRQQRTASLRNAKVRPKNRFGALLSILGGKPLMRLLARFY